MPESSFPLELRAAALIAASNLVAAAHAHPSMYLQPGPDPEKDVAARMQAILEALPKKLIS